MRELPYKESLVAHFFPDKIPSLLYALCIMRIQAHQTIPSNASSTVDWLAKIDAPRQYKKCFAAEKRCNEDAAISYYEAFADGKPIQPETRKLAETLLRRRMEEPQYDLEAEDPNNIPYIRAAFLAHTLKSIPPTEEESDERMQRMFRQINPPGSSNRQRLKNALAHTKRSPEEVIPDPYEEGTMIEVAKRVGWYKELRPDVGSVAQAIYEQSSLILRFIGLMYGRRPVTMEQVSRNELLAAMDFAEKGLRVLH